MSTSALPGVMLALLQKFASLDYSLGNTQDPTLYIFDGITGPNLPDNYVSLGGEQDPAASGEQQWANLGATAVNEDITIECEVSSYVGGTDDGSNWSPSSTVTDQVAQVSDAQLSARTNAFAIYAAIEVALKNDPQLAAVDNPPTGLLWTKVGQREQIIQTARNDPESMKGRRCRLIFTIYGKVRLYP